MLETEIAELTRKKLKLQSLAAATSEAETGTAVDNKLWFTLKKNEHEANKFEITLNSQNPIRRIVLKKPESSIVEFDKTMSAMVIENPNRVLAAD